MSDKEFIDQLIAGAVFTDEVYCTNLMNGDAPIYVIHDVCTYNWKDKMLYIRVSYLCTFDELEMINRNKKFDFMFNEEVYPAKIANNVITILGHIRNEYFNNINLKSCMTDVKNILYDKFSSFNWTWSIYENPEANLKRISEEKMDKYILEVYDLIEQEKEEEKQAKIRKEEEKRKQDKLEEKLRKEKEEKRKQKGKEFYERMQRAKKEKADRIEAENKWYYWKHTLPTCSSNIKISDKSALDLILTDLYDKSDGGQCESFIDLLIESPQASREFLCMYQTHSDKEVAKEYGISISTVNEAINAIKSAYCIKRGAM